MLSARSITASQIHLRFLLRRSARIPTVTCIAEIIRLVARRRRRRAARSSWWSIILPGWIAHRLRVAPHIPIRVHALHIALHGIRREEHARYRIIIPGVVVVKPCHRVGILAGKAFGGIGGHGAALVALGAIGAVDLIGEDSGAAHHVGEGGDDAAERIGQEDVGVLAGVGGQFADMPLLSTDSSDRSRGRSFSGNISGKIGK